MKLRLPHFHRDPNWRVVGCHALYECKCGARRTCRAYSNLMGPIAAGWPDTRNKHGQLTYDSGWIKP